MGPVAVVPLNHARMSRLGDILVGVLVTAVAAAVFIFIGAAVYGMINKPAGIVVWAIGGVLCIMAFVSAVRRALKPAPRLSLYDDRLVIDHDEVFEPPPEIPKANIAHVAVEYRSHRIRPLHHETAFPIGDIDDAIYPGESGYLYDSEEGNPIPLICAGADVPNLAVIFHEPYRFTTTRRFKAAFMSSDKYRLELQFPNRIDDVTGFLTRVADPRAAEQTFAAWGAAAGAERVPIDHGRRAFPDPATYRARLNRGPMIFGISMGVAGFIAWLMERAG